MKFDDEEFIDNAYELILGRKADPQGRDNYLLKLKSRVLSKAQIVALLHFSDEGKEQSITINGIKRPYFRTMLLNIPFLGYIVRSITILASLPKMMDRHLELETKVETKASKQQLKDMIEELDNKTKQQLKDMIEELDNKTKQQLKEKAYIKDLEMYQNSISYAKKEIEISKQNIQSLVEEIRKRVPSKELEQLQAIVKEEKHNFDSLYVSFEDQFRGSKQEIKEKLKVYMPYIKDISDRAINRDDIKILDVGCGRGEWLELLKESGFKNIKGIDLNRVMVSISQSQNQDVECIDVLEYLKTQSDETLTIITGFHIIEHLPFETLMALFRESFRVLKKGGMIIYETPNPRNILVGASDFYLDPTHINPIHPSTLKFLVIQTGFIQVQSLILDKGKLVDFDLLAFDELKDYIDIGRDLAVIGYKV